MFQKRVRSPPPRSPDVHKMRRCSSLALGPWAPDVQKMQSHGAVLNANMSTARHLAIVVVGQNAKPLWYIFSAYLEICSTWLKFCLLELSAIDPVHVGGWLVSARAYV